MTNRILKLVIHWLRLYSVTITQWFCSIESSHLSYAVRRCFCTRTGNHSPTRHYPPGTTGCCTNLLLSRFPWELTVLPWRLQGFSPWFKTKTQPYCLFESQAIHKYLNNTRFYINFSKYISELVVAKSLTNIRKFTYFNIHFLQYLF